MSKKFINFDQVFEERDNSPVIVHMFGRDWELPPSLSADIPLQIIRLQADGVESLVSNSKIAALVTQIVPEEILNEWVKLGLGMDQYETLLTRLLSLYTGRNLETEGEKMAPHGASDQKSS